MEMSLLQLFETISLQHVRMWVYLMEEALVVGLAVIAALVLMLLLVVIFILTSRAARFVLGLLAL